jgi:site-specific recombinase XerD
MTSRCLQPWMDRTARTVPMKHRFCRLSMTCKLSSFGCPGLDKDSHTYRAYRREAERILLWAIIARGKAFSSLHTLDLSDYRRFLQDPMPVEQWIGSPRKKGHADWRPFAGPLSERSTRYAETVLNALFSWLVDQHYLQTNPVKGMPKLSRTKQQLDINRSFSKSEWKLIKDYLAAKMLSSEQKAQRHYGRIHLILNTLYCHRASIARIGKGGAWRYCKS